MKFSPVIGSVPVPSEGSREEAKTKVLFFFEEYIGAKSYSGEFIVYIGSTMYLLGGSSIDNAAISEASILASATDLSATDPYFSYHSIASKKFS